MALARDDDQWAPLFKLARALKFEIAMRGLGLSLRGGAKHFAAAAALFGDLAHAAPLPYAGASRAALCTISPACSAAARGACALASVCMCARAHLSPSAHPLPAAHVWAQAR